ncbi:MATE family efflux transporter [uncultured Helicobacter sp.]|mgnify:CR=1 FL=1|uniref:MATE family efflux transporter n=1 Tax=uncultured Helicobacter sp. TaxID=175537 RepID=UPI001C3BE4C2|nr:MATE family efflux transporter [Candidatus Helicobacter avicola]
MRTFSLKHKLIKISSIALPSGANSLLDMANVTVGMYFVSEFSKEHMIALNVGMNYIMMLFAITAIFFIGTSAQVARFYGAREYQKLQQAMGNNFLIALFSSIPLLVLAYVCSESYLDWMGRGVSGEAKHLGLEYLGIVVFGIPALMTKTICVAGLSALGDTKRVMYIKLITTTFNVVLNYVLIFGFDFGIFTIDSLGVFGAGLCNMCITYLEALLLFGAMYLRKNVLRFAFVLRLEYSKNMFNIGVPAGIERFLTLFSLVLTQKFMSEYGADIIAGFQIGSKVEAFILTFGFGFQVAAMALVGQSLGKKRMDLAYDFLKTLLVFSSVIMGILGLVICVWGIELSKIFNTEEAVLRASLYYIIAVGLSQVPLVMIFCLDGALRGVGATKLSLMINATSIWVLRIVPMYLCVAYQSDVRIVFGIIFIETYLRAFVFGAVFKSKIWEKFIKRF